MSTKEEETDTSELTPSEEEGAISSPANEEDIVVENKLSPNNEKAKSSPKVEDLSEFASLFVVDINFCPWKKPEQRVSYQSLTLEPEKAYASPICFLIRTYAIGKKSLKTRSHFPRPPPLASTVARPRTLSVAAHSYDVL
jgi:hypothetical protein